MSIVKMMAILTRKIYSVGTHKRAKMKAIIEIPDELIRSAGSAIGLSKPHLMDIAILAMERLSGVKEMTISLDDTDQKDVVEANIAMMCVTQVMCDITKNHEQN